MSLCSILVHLTGSERSGARLRVAADLARRNAARLTGIFARVASQAEEMEPDWPPRGYVKAADASRAGFVAATQGLDAQWRDLNRGEEGDILPQMVDLTRHFDLVVIGQPRAGDPLTPPGMAEEIIIQSGRPALVIPYVGDFAQVGERPVFAWSDARSAARGFCDGMMLVAKGAEALVVGLSKPNDARAFANQKEALHLAVAHLAAHHVTAHAEQLSLGDIGLMDALLNRAADHGADLLAIGAFGGGGYPLFSRGAGSRYMLRHMTVPVLLSH